MAARKQVSPAVLKERQSSTFNVEFLTNLLDGGAHSTKRRREIQQIGLRDPVFSEGPPMCFLTRDEQYDRAVKKAVRVTELVNALNLTDDERSWLMRIAFPAEGCPDFVHHIMFVPTVLNQATNEQKEKWLPRIKSRQYIGTYSQTELGHGTHVRKLETTATYDPHAEEFVVHSPTLSAMKWWPGGQGKTCNCALVMAQVLSQGNTHGVFPIFIVFRDLDTHVPLPGITVGDIGPKMGFNTMDNGFLKFDNFRVPRENLLMKHVEVLKDGTFIRKTKQKKSTYIAMTMVRMKIIKVDCFEGLSSAVTIAIRYSAVRRQSELQPGAPEPQIMDYQTQQYKLFPYLATTYAFKFAADNLSLLYREGVRRLRDDDDSMMTELHALSSGLKAYCSNFMCLGIEQCRLACGGHGYSEASGLSKVYTAMAPATTVEGEISVLYLQLAKYLIRCFNAAEHRRELDGSVEYLGDEETQSCSIDERLTLVSLTEAFDHRARRMIGEARASVRQRMKSGLPEYAAMNQCGVFLTRAAIVHCEAFIVKHFATATNDIDDNSIAKVMIDLCQLFAAHKIVNKSGDFIEDGYMSGDQLDILRQKEVSLLAAVRPNAVALVDAFDIPDETLGSVLGRYDGHVYENLYKWALNSPLNKSQVHESYYKYLQPMMASKI